MMRDEVFGQLANRLVFEEQSLGQRTKRLFQLVRQLHRQDRVDAVYLQRGSRINLLERRLQQFRQLLAQVVLRLLGETSSLDFGRHNRLFRLRFGWGREAVRLDLCDGVNLFAQPARRQSAHLYTDVSALIAQIDIQLDDLISRLTARRVPYPRNHVRGAWPDDSQRVQRKRHSWLASLTFGFGPAVHQPDRGLQRAVHQTRMENIVSRRVRHD